MKKEALKGLADRFKKNPTRSEKQFQLYLKQENIPFLFQHIVCGYIPDFYFPHHAGKIIELDGQCHEYTVVRDGHRDDRLRAAGHQVLRIPSSWAFKPALLKQCVGEFLFNGLPRSTQPKKKKARKSRRQFRERSVDPLTAEFFAATHGI